MKFRVLLTVLTAIVGLSTAAAKTSSAYVSPPLPPQKLHEKKVLIDPGHNGGNSKNLRAINQIVNAGNGVRKACDTTGTQTRDGSLTEAWFNFDVSQRLAKILRSHGVEVVLTRNDDRSVGPCITERAAIGNRSRADLAISIHADGGPTSKRGFHIIYPADNAILNRLLVARSKRLALHIRDQLKTTAIPKSNYAGRDGLVQRSDLGGLNLSTVPKVFVELGNMKNTTDAKLLKSAAFRQILAGRLAQGSLRFLN